MDIDFSTILDRFIEWFVLEEAKPQAFLELKDPKKRQLFTHTLASEPSAVLDMRFIHPLDPSHQTKEQVKKQLYSKGRNLCYVISNDSTIDNTVMEVDFAVDKVFGKGDGTLLLTLQVDRLYMETSPQSAVIHRFIGRTADLT